MTGAVLNRTPRPLGDQQLAILRALYGQGWQTTNSIQRMIQSSISTVRNALNALCMRDYVESDCGEPERWLLTDAGEQAMREGA